MQFFAKAAEESVDALYVVDPHPFQTALTVYFLAFIIATCVAAIIKLIVMATSKKKAKAPVAAAPAAAAPAEAPAKEGEVS